MTWIRIENVNKNCQRDSDLYIRVCDNEGLKKDYSIPDLHFVNRDIMDSINESVVPSINQSKPFIAKF